MEVGDQRDVCLSILNLMAVRWMVEAERVLIRVRVSDHGITRATVAASRDSLGRHRESEG